MIAGNFDDQRALALVQEKFGVIPRPARVMDRTYTMEPTQEGASGWRRIRRSGQRAARVMTSSIMSRLERIRTFPPSTC